MRILFISSGNTKSGITPIVKNQGESLRKLGNEVEFFAIKGKGFLGYLRNIFILRKFLKTKSFDVMHAHYSLSAMVASLAGARPLVVSLMGSDVKASPVLARLIKVFYNLFWSNVIVKSLDMKNASGISKSYIIPNGVNFEKFRPVSRTEALQKTGWDKTKTHILFAANPGRPEKNYALAENAIKSLDEDTIRLQKLIDVPNEEMPYYFNAADIVLLTSLWEGSPNVIKEAMACNCKIVVTDVGDVVEIINDTEGCFVTGFSVEEVTRDLKKALQYPPKTNGRDQIKYLDEKMIAHQLLEIYKTTIS